MIPGAPTLVLVEPGPGPGGSERFVVRDLESQLTHVPVAALAEAIVVTGDDGRIALVNPAAEALFA